MSALAIHAHTDDRTAELDEVLERKGRELVEEVRAMGIDVQAATLIGATTNADLTVEKAEPEEAAAVEKARSTSANKARRSTSARNKAR